MVCMIPFSTRHRWILIHWQGGFRLETSQVWSSVWQLETFADRPLWTNRATCPAGNWRDKKQYVSRCFNIFHAWYFHISQCVCAYWWAMLYKLSVLASCKFLRHHGAWAFPKKFGMFGQGSNLGCRRPRHLHVLMASLQSHLMGIGNYWHWIGLLRIAFNCYTFENVSSSNNHPRFTC